MTPIPYDGNMMVTDVIKFIADHGRNSHHLSREKGIFLVESLFCDSLVSDSSFLRMSLLHIGYLLFIPILIFHCFCWNI